MRGAVATGGRCHAHASAALARTEAHELGPESRSDNWHEHAAAGCILALRGTGAGDEHVHRAGSIELSFEADEPFEVVKERLDAAGFTGAGIVDEAFGRSMQIIDPDGVHVQVNESDTSLYA